MDDLPRPAPGPLDTLTWPRRTERLLVRPAAASDAPAVWGYRQVPEVAEWIGWAPPTEAAFTATFSEPDRLARTLVVELDGQVVGDLMLLVGDGWSQAEVREQARGTQAEIGWVVDPAHQGRGLATEAVADLLALCFADLGLRRVTALCFADNTASWRLMERLGMRCETRSRADSLHRSGRWLDGLGYALLAEEWRDPGAASPAVARPGG